MPKCDHCKTKFIAKYFNQKHCLTTDDCLTAFRLYAAVQRKKSEDKKWKEEKKVMQEKLKTLSDYKKDLEKEINAIVRLIDKGHECISGGFKVYEVNAGHLYSVGSFPALRFHLMNIYAQSVHDNKHKGGNGVIYKERIVEIFGKEVSQEIEGLKLKYKELHITIPELKEAIKKAREVKRSLEKADLEYTTEQRITLRRKFNQIIGVYN